MALSPIAKRRAFGQHFLKDQKIASQIADLAVAAALETGSRTLLEIGPGKGAITFPILEKLQAKQSTVEFRLVEKDFEFAKNWKSRGIKIDEGDFLLLPESVWLRDSPVAVVSNLPYSSGTAILLQLAAYPKRIPKMILMFQAEVAQRLYADPNTKAWGSLSIFIQNQWKVSRILNVPPGAFAPPPQVNSEIVQLEPLDQPQVSGTLEEEDLWNQLLRVTFAHRRKMLRSGLPATGPWRNALEMSGVDGKKRSESLSWEEWAKLFNALRLARSSIRK